MADTGTTITCSSNTALLLAAVFLFNHGFHVGLYFEIKVPYWYMKYVWGGAAGA